MTSDLTSAVSSFGGSTFEGRFFRYAPPQARLVGSSVGGRWNPAGSFPVLYFADSRDSAIAEIYRRIINSSTPPLPASGVILGLNEYAIAPENILDLRANGALARVGLTPADIRTGLGKYERCQEVGKIAHQCGYHGIFAPAASGVGAHLALFDQQLDLGERPEFISSEILNGIPPHPTRLRLVDESSS